MSTRRKILVVEDEAIIAFDLMLLLQRLGVESVGPAQTVAGARKIIVAEPVDAAILNVRLGKERVYRLADDLRDQSIPFALITGEALEDLPLRFRGAPYFRKPVADTMIKAWVEALPPGTARPIRRRKWKKKPNP